MQGGGGGGIVCAPVCRACSAVTSAKKISSFLWGLPQNELSKCKIISVKDVRRSSHEKEREQEAALTKQRVIHNPIHTSLLLSRPPNTLHVCMIYKWKNHFYEMKGDVGMSLHEKERKKKMPTPRYKVTHNPIPTSLFYFNMLFVCLL